MIVDLAYRSLLPTRYLAAKSKVALVVGTKIQSISIALIAKEKGLEVSPPNFVKRSHQPMTSIGCGAAPHSKVGTCGVIGSLPTAAFAFDRVGTLLAG